jgi:rhodanese-related sulfurtransferase
MPMQRLLTKEKIDSQELETLLEARKEGKVDFLLIDVREEHEYDAGHLEGVDMLKPTSLFSQWGQVLFTEAKEQTIIFTCRTGSRSGQVQDVFRDNGHTGVINHTGGIVSYNGKIER